MTDYERGEWAMFELVSSIWHGKQYYFRQDNDIVYSRESCRYLTVDEAYAEFFKAIGDDGSI